MYVLVTHKSEGPGRPSHEVSYGVSQCLWVLVVAKYLWVHSTEFLHALILAPRILRLRLGFRNICAPLPHILCRKSLTVTFVRSP